MNDELARGVDMVRPVNDETRWDALRALTHAGQMDKTVLYALGLVADPVRPGPRPRPDNRPPCPACGRRMTCDACTHIECAGMPLPTAVKR